MTRTSALTGFALGGAALYLAILLATTLGLGEAVPLLGWIGFGVVVLVVGAIAGGLAVFLVRSAREAGAEPVAHGVAAGGAKRVLLVAETGCSETALCAVLAGMEVFVTAPALVSPIHYLDSDLDQGRAAAQQRLDALVGALTAAGVTARGVVGSESPLEAIADALAVFPADEIVIAAAEGERRNWLDLDVVERARRAHGVPVSGLTAAT